MGISSHSDRKQAEKQSARVVKTWKRRIILAGDEPQRRLISRYAQVLIVFVRRNETVLVRTVATFLLTCFGPGGVEIMGNDGMTLGTGIFLSSILLSFIWLYVATKDRWRWKRIALWGLGMLIGVPALIAVGVAGNDWYQDRPAARNEFEGIKLGMSRDDVRFVKGEPSGDHSKLGEYFVYDLKTDYGSGNPFLIVAFHNDRVSAVEHFSNGGIFSPNIFRLNAGDSYEKLTDALGAPSSVSASPDGLKRILSFDKFQVFFSLEKGSIASLGIYDPAVGPRRYAAKSDPQ